MKLFNEKAEVDYCGRWNTVEEPTFLLRPGHVVTEPSTEEETVGRGLIDDMLLPCWC